MGQLTIVSAKQMPMGKEHENVFLFQVIIESFCSVKYGDVFIRFGEMTSNLSINGQVFIKHKGPPINQPYRSLPVMHLNSFFLPIQHCHWTNEYEY